MVLDSKTSQRIFALAKEQQEELGEGVDDDEEDEDDQNYQPRMNLNRDFDDEEDADSDMEGSIDAEEYAERVHTVFCPNATLIIYFKFSTLTRKT